ncbi:MAG: sn-glycerol-3-phosphate ABC transporter ATP-binding protein UgpC [Planctomycetes bacterium]|nr:sn-glycerol-3-phosphate ABC transporter ATP-binding protein UgpC [Planctomycetota bacterium]
MATLELIDVCKKFGASAVLQDVSLSVDDGEFVVFVGPSGCGKSTLLRTIAGLEDASAGLIRIDGAVVNGVDAAKRGLAMVFQSYALYPHMTVEQNMAFGLKLARLPKADIDARIKAAAEVLKIGDLLGRLPKTLSGGQRQRVAIGRAIVREPKIFLFDEPLSNLDAELRVQMRIELARLHARLKATMIYVTHDQVEAMTLADKIVVLQAGRVEQIGAPLDLYNRPANSFVAGFIGSPRMNFIAARIEAIGPQGVRAAIGGEGDLVHFAVDGSRLRIGDSTILGIRPESIAIRPAGDGETTGLAAEIILDEQLGSGTCVHAMTRAGDILVSYLQGQVPLRKGAAVRLSLPATACHLFDRDGTALVRLE